MFREIHRYIWLSNWFMGRGLKKRTNRQTDRQNSVDFDIDGTWQWQTRPCVEIWAMSGSFDCVVSAASALHDSMPIRRAPARKNTEIAWSFL